MRGKRSGKAFLVSGAAKQGKNSPREFLANLGEGFA